MEAKRYLKLKAMMSNYCSNCDDCPLCCLNNEKEMFCGDLEQFHPELAVQIVEDWASRTMYKIPADTPVDTMVLCSNDDSICQSLWPKGYFAGYEDGEMTAWFNGKTSKETLVKIPYKYMILFVS